MEEEFSTAFLPQNTDFDNCPQMTVPLWKFGSLVERFQHTTEEKILRLDVLKMVRGIVSFYSQI